MIWHIQIVDSENNVNHIVPNEMMNDYYLNEEFLNSEVLLGDEGE